jgi:hypothetical protein
VKTQLVSNLSSVHSVGKILFVCEYEKKGITEFVFIEHTLELLTSFGDTLTIVGIDYEDDSLGILEVCKVLVSRKRSLGRL